MKSGGLSELMNWLRARSFILVTAKVEDVETINNNTIRQTQILFLSNLADSFISHGSTETIQILGSFRTSEGQNLGVNQGF